MHLKTFEAEIPKTILQRGKDYYHDGAVTDLQGMDNGQWFAIVEGSNDYEVDVRLGKNGEVLDYSCSCPYDGGICKHTVAVLYQLKAETPVTEPSKKTKEQGPWKNIISAVPDVELREFVKEYAAKSKDFRNILMVKFSGYDTRENSDKYRHVLNSIFTTTEGRHGYIEYNNTHGAMQQVYSLLVKADEYIEQGNYNEAFHIAASVAPSCISAIQSMDDSDGECGGAINDAFEIISKILHSNANPSIKNQAFDWLRCQAENNDYDDYGCADELYPMLVGAVDSPERATSVMTFLEDQLKKASLKEGWSKEYQTKKFLNFKMELFKKTGQEDKADEIITKNMQIHDYRRIVVGRHIDEHNFNEAIRLMKEGVSIAARENSAGVVANWNEMLMDIYRKQNNVKELRAIAKEMYYSGGYGKKHYLEYRATFGEEEWLAELEKIIETHKKNEKAKNSLFKSIPQHLASVYIEEKMWGELYGLLQKNADIHSLLQYSQYLVKDYAPELVSMYKISIDWAAEKASDRRGYQEIATYILRMSEIPGGKEPARLLVTQLMEKHNKRPAMKDELKKIFKQ